MAYRGFQQIRVLRGDYCISPATYWQTGLMFDQLAAGEGFDGPVAMCGVLSAERMYARYDLRNLSLLVQGFLK